MGKGKRRGRGRRDHQPAATVHSWADAEGLHLLLPGHTPSEADVEEMTRVYQEKVRQSPLWDEMVRQFGQKEAERLLREFRVEKRR